MEYDSEQHLPPEERIRKLEQELSEANGREIVYKEKIDSLEKKLKEAQEESERIL